LSAWSSHCPGPSHKPISGSRRSLRVSSRRTTHRGPGCGSMRNSVQRGEALLAFGPSPIEGAEHAAQVLTLSQQGDLIEAAANLFSHLRALDASGAAVIAVMPVPHDGLGEAINDRLRRAAAPR